jgi:hypothetical protein
MENQILSEILERLDKIEERLGKLESTPPLQKDKEKKGISMREFLLSKMPNDEIQKTLLICYYLESYDGTEYFNVKDIESGFRSAKEKVPKNINYNVYMNIKKGYVMEHNEKKDNMKSWVLTNSGSKFVESNFGNKGQ